MSAVCQYTVVHSIFINLLLFFRPFVVKICPTGPACLQSRGAEKVEKWGEAAEEGPVSQPGRRQHFTVPWSERIHVYEIFSLVLV